MKLSQKCSDFGKILRKTAAILVILLAGTSVFAAEHSALKNSAETKTKETKSANPRVEFVKGLQKLLGEGKLSEAIAGFDTLPDSLKKDTNLLLIKASLFISANRLDEASALLDSLEKDNPSNMDILEMKIVAAKAGGDNPKSKAQKKDAISKVLALDPNNTSANIELAQELVLQHKSKEARKYYQKALAADPKNDSALFGYGQTSYYEKDLDEAETAFNKMISLDEKNAIAYQYLGKVEAQRENYKRALEYVKKAIELEDDSYEFYMDLGMYSRFTGKYADAEKAWTKAISLNPDYFLAYAYRAGLYDEQNKFEPALKDYRKVVETNPKYYFAYESLGMFAWHESNYDEARKAFETAYSYNKENVSYPLMIAACMIKANKYPQAKLFLEKVMKEWAEKQSIEFAMLRMYHDLGPRNAETDMALRIQKEEKSNTRGKMLYYFALFYELKATDTLAAKYYTEVKNMRSPMFFEYRLAEWSLEK